MYLFLKVALSLYLAVFFSFFSTDIPWSAILLKATRKTFFSETCSGNFILRYFQMASLLEPYLSPRVKIASVIISINWSFISNFVVIFKLYLLLEIELKYLKFEF